MFKFSQMPLYKEQGCCDDGCDCAISNPKSDLVCPKCHNLGEKVSNLTVHSLTKKEFKNDIDKKANDAFNICITPECKMAYYNEEKNILTKQLKTQFHLKNDSTVHIICYCLKITKEDIIDAVHNKKLTGMKDIMIALKGKPPCVCEKNNPTGLCCENSFNEVIKDSISTYSKI